MKIHNPRHVAEVRKLAMEISLFLFIVLIMVGCGESIDLDDKETRGKIIAEAIDWDEIVKRDQAVYDANDQTPLTGWVKMVHDNGQVGFLGLFKDGKQFGVTTEWHENGQKSRTRIFDDGKLILALVWKPNGAYCSVTKIDEGGNGIVVSYNEDGTEHFRETYKDGEPVED